MPFPLKYAYSYVSIKNLELYETNLKISLFIILITPYILMFCISAVYVKVFSIKRCTLKYNVRRKIT